MNRSVISEKAIERQRSATPKHQVEKYENPECALIEDHAVGYPVETCAKGLGLRNATMSVQIRK